MAQRSRQRKPDPPDSAVLLPFATMPVAQPPPPPRPFVGRDHDQAQILRQLNQERVLLLTGIASSGKTALAATMIQQSAHPRYWLPITADFTDSAEAFLWRLAQPLAERHPDTWQALHQVRQAQWNYPPFVLFQMIMAAYDRSAEEILLCIDGLNRQLEPALVSLLRELGEHIRSTQHLPLKLLLVGRSIPYRLKPWPTLTLTGINTDALIHWAWQLGVALDQPAASMLLQQTAGLPGILEPILLALRTQPDLLPTMRIVDQLAVRHFFSEIVQQLSLPEKHMLFACVREAVPVTSITYDQLVTLTALEDQHLVHTNTNQIVALHPLLQLVIEQHIARE